MPIPSNIATSIEDRTRQIVLFVREIKIMEIEKIVNHYIEVPKPIKYI